jgi:putative chitinase
MAFINALYNLWPNGDDKVPGLRDGIAASAPAVFAKYGIQNKNVLAHIMAQISHECGAGLFVEENMSYTAKRMTEVWPSRFPTIESAQPYAKNPRKLANKVYNGRMGNVTGTDDGYNFRGRGGSQTTGREGYERVKKQTGLDVVNNPDILIDPKYFLECAVSDFINCGCMPYALQDNIEMVTKKLNGGQIGIADRRQWLAKWKKANVDVPLETP